MRDFRRSLHLCSAIVAALLGLQLASCADVEPAEDQAPPGVLMPPAAHPTAPPLVPPAPHLATSPVPQVAAGSLIALLLPLTGRQSAAALAVRDGFLTAYYSMPAAVRPGMHVYDTGQMSVAAPLNQATQAGAGLIVGPLTREEVTAAAGFTGVRPPMLTL